MTDLTRLVADTPIEELPRLLGDLEAAKAAAWVRLTVPAANGNGHGEADRNLSAAEAARRLGVSLPYLYKHAREYPFTVRIGRRVVFDGRGLEAWNRGERA